MRFFKRMTSCAVSALCAASCLCYYDNVYAEEAETHTVTFCNFNGTTLQTVTVEHGGTIDYASIDTSSLKSQIDDYTQIRFYAWDSTPETITEDITITPLYQKAVLSIVSKPERNEFYAKSGNITLDGLNVSIILTTQIKTDEGIVEDTANKFVQEITDGCTAQPSTLDEAFAEGNTSTVVIYPPGADSSQSRPLITYNITCFDKLGDTNDDGSIDPIDATNALVHYSNESMNSPSSLTQEQINAADVDRNGVADVLDATEILKYFSQCSLDSNINWETYFSSQK